MVYFGISLACLDQKVLKGNGTCRMWTIIYKVGRYCSSFTVTLHVLIDVTTKVLRRSLYIKGPYGPRDRYLSWSCSTCQHIITMTSCHVIRVHVRTV